MDNTPYKEQSIVQQVLTSNVKFVIGVITIALGVVAPYYQIQQHLALIDAAVANINANHEVHDQDILQSIKDLNVQEVNQEAQIIELQKELIVITGRIQ